LERRRLPDAARGAGAWRPGERAGPLLPWPARRHWLRTARPRLRRDDLPRLLRSTPDGPNGVAQPDRELHLRARLHGPVSVVAAPHRDRLSPQAAARLPPDRRAVRPTRRPLRAAEPGGSGPAGGAGAADDAARVDAGDGGPAPRRRGHPADAPLGAPGARNRTRAGHPNAGRGLMQVAAASRVAGGAGRPNADARADEARPAARARESCDLPRRTSGAARRRLDRGSGWAPVGRVASADAIGWG